MFISQLDTEIKSLGFPFSLLGVFLLIMDGQLGIVLRGTIIAATVEFDARD